MTNFSTSLLEKLSDKHLLKHPFYRAWNMGELSKETLRTYAKQYFAHVKAFPRYVSAAHSLCDDISQRQVLLENLIDEERGAENHPELWTRFAEGLGEDRTNMQSEELMPETKTLVDTFTKLTRSSFPEAVGALFAYENQVPEVSANKIEGLKKFYGIEDERSTQFFNVHLKADVYHTQALTGILDTFNATDQEKARAAAIQASSALWNFLSGMEKVHQKETCCGSCC